MIETVSFAELSEKFDIFFFDQFGVLHDGSTPYPGALAALMTLKSADKTVVILSNSGKSETDNGSRLTRLGFPPDAYNHFVTSGDVAAALLASRIEPGLRCLTVSRSNDRNLADRLDLTPVDDPNAAQLLVLSGSEADRLPMSYYRELFAPMAARGVPAICTNPDIEMLTPSGLHPSAGALADLYEALGGKVERIGKPYRPIYDYAHRLCGTPDRARIVAIGDSIEHDIVGARDFGISAALVRQGVSRDLSDATLAQAFDAQAIDSAFVLAGLE